MRNYGLLTVFLSVLIIISCGKDEDEVSERFRFLTGSVWVSDSLLVNGVDASGPGQLLEDFKGDVKFNEDGTGSFAQYTGTWRFAQNETQLVITTEALPVQLTTNIVELTAGSLKITTGYPNPVPPPDVFSIRMTFKAK